MNEGHLLAVTHPSMEALRREVELTSGRSDWAASVTMTAFRPNVVFDGDRLAAYAEDSWACMRSVDADYGGTVLRMVGQCGRCSQVCPIDAATGKRLGPEPLLTLSKRRMRAGRPRFGILLELASGGEHSLQIGQTMHVEVIGC